MSQTPRAFVCGCSGLTFTDDEVTFIERWQPWGLILFRRNVADRKQIAALTAGFRSLVGRPDAPVLIDQEGGRVQRLAPPFWSAYPAASTFARTIANPDDQARAAFLATRLIAADLIEVGVTIDCMPVLDVPAPKSHTVIGDRAYADGPDEVGRLGRAAAEGLLAGGVLPVIKHMPGHGRARADSHHELPRVDASLVDLERTDFAPFRANADLPLAMTAHVVFSAIDPGQPATLSPIVVEQVIRGRIGFDGLLISDDLSMKALSGSFGERARRLFEAGVDIALHCNGNLDEATAVAAETPLLAGRAAARVKKVMAGRLTSRGSFDPVDARAELDGLLGSHLAATA